MRRYWKYIYGFIKNFCNLGVSLFAFVDYKSVIDKKTKVNSFSKIYKSTIGRYSYVGRNTSITCADIGSFCSISSDCVLGLANHTLDFLSTSPLFSEKNNGTGYSWTNMQKNPFEKLYIGNDVWVGTKAIVMGGLTIGDGAVIAAGSIVTKDIPPYAIVAGIPARIIRYRFSEEVIEEIMKIQWWNLSDEKLKENIYLFQSNTINLNELKSLRL